MLIGVFSLPDPSVGVRIRHITNSVKARRTKVNCIRSFVSLTDFLLDLPTAKKKEQRRELIHRLSNIE